MDVGVLEDVGLTKNESRVYLALLRIGASFSGRIIEASGVYSANVYNALERLAEKGLVSYVVKNNKKFYEATEPGKLQELLKSREDSLGFALPELKSLYERGRVVQEVRVFKGREGLKAVLEDVYNTLKGTKNEWLVFGSTGFGAKVLGYWVDAWEKKRARTGIWLRVTMNLDPQGVAGGERFKRFPRTEVRYMPRGFVSPATFYSYFPKAAIIVWSGEEPLGVVFEDERIARGIKNSFDFLWKAAAKTPPSNA
jgi:sugar-specific transcriptional regulator TrmB